jgi:hypothetical protein
MFFQKMAFFRVTTMKTSNLTYAILILVTLTMVFGDVAQLSTTEYNQHFGRTAASSFGVQGYAGNELMVQIQGGGELETFANIY